jgi:hypothetical protein
MMSFFFFAFSVRAQPFKNPSFNAVKIFTEFQICKFRRPSVLTEFRPAERATIQQRSACLASKRAISDADRTGIHSRAWVGVHDVLCSWNLGGLCRPTNESLRAP